MTELQQMQGRNTAETILKVINLPALFREDGSKHGIMVSALEAFCLMMFECFDVVRQKEESP